MAGSLYFRRRVSPWERWQEFSHARLQGECHVGKTRGGYEYLSENLGDYLHCKPGHLGHHGGTATFGLTRLFNQINFSVKAVIVPRRLIDNRRRSISWRGTIKRTTQRTQL